MSDLRIERFSDRASLVRVAEGDKVPPLGWAIRFDGAVFFDGVQVGRSGKYVFNRVSSTPYEQIAYEALDPD
jgi:hypothetical protein